MIDEGLVLLDGRRPKASDVILCGNLIKIKDSPRRKMSAGSDSVNIVFKNEDIIVVDKGISQVVYPSRVMSQERCWMLFGI
jgi:23S rRNA-/tRNA-specific pseudouridylate synthase